MEILVSVLVGSQFLSFFVFYHLMTRFSRIQRKMYKSMRKHYDVSCAVGNDTVANFQKVFAYIEHQLQKEKSDEQHGLPGTQM